MIGISRALLLRGVLASTALSCFARSATAAQAAAKPLKLVVYGNGRIGSRIATEALNRGHSVTVVVRKPEDVKQSGAKLKVVKGDILDTDDVAKQIAGHDVVVAAVNGPTVSIFIDGGKSIVAAQRRVGANPPRFIWIGGASSMIDKESGKMLFEAKPIPNAPPAAAPGHIGLLEYLRTVNDVPWTFFSPAVVAAPGQRTGKFRLGGDNPIYDANGKSEISMEDLAIATVDEAEKPAHNHQRFTIGY